MLLFAIILLFYIELIISISDDDILVNKLDSNICTDLNAVDTSTHCYNHAFTQIVDTCNNNDKQFYNCNEVSVTITDIKSIKDILRTLDTDVSVRRVIFNINSKITVSSDFDGIGEMVDSVLTPRPWWRVLEEPYQWNFSSDGQHSYSIIFERFVIGYEKILRFFTSVQFPSDQKTCENSVLMVGTDELAWHGLGWILLTYDTFRKKHPYAIQTIYVSDNNSLNYSTSFVSASDCPNEANKWACAFLPTTNCSIPNILTDCRFVGCIPRLRNCGVSSACFDSATLTAKSVDIKDKEALERMDTPRNAQQHYLAGHKMDAIKTHHMEHLAEEHLFKHEFLARKNYDFRARMAHFISEMRRETGFSSDTRCVAAHIRRGDRTLAVTGMLGDKTNGTVDWWDFCAKNVDNPHIVDFGCYNVPFALVRLQHVIESAEKMVDSGVRDIVLATDDDEWAVQEIEKYYAKNGGKNKGAKWRIHMLHAPNRDPNNAQTATRYEELISITKNLGKKPMNDTSTEDYWYRRMIAGTSAGVLLHAQLQLNQQCEAFFGHFASTISKLMADKMCVMHNLTSPDGFSTNCPPLFDARKITSLTTFIHPAHKDNLVRPSSWAPIID